MEFLLIILVNLIHLPAVWFGVISDDATVLKTNPYPVKKSKIISIILHTIISLYVYWAFGHNQISLFAAVLFSVHPLTIQVSCWWSGRWYGVNALIYLMVVSFPFLAPLYFLSTTGIANNLFTPLTFIFTKSWWVILIFPLFILQSFKSIKENITLKIAGDAGFKNPVLQDDFTLHSWKWANLILVVKTFGYYSLACLSPIKNGFYNSFLATVGSSKKATDYWYSLNRHFWGGLFAIVLMAVIWWFNKTNFIGMGIMLFVTSLIPFLNFVTVQQFTAPRYAYLPLIGFQIALVGLISYLPIPTQTAILFSLFVFYLDRLLKVMRVYAKDQITAFELDSQEFPENPRLWYYRYEHMLHKNNAVMAWAEASYGLKHLPEDCQLWFGLAVASFELGDMNAASEFLKTSERFIILAERKNMQYLIDEMRARIKLKLQEKFIPKRRF